MPLLFSYGTLRQKEVQLATCARLLEGEHDALTGYRLRRLAITDPRVVRLSGKPVHTIACRTGDPANRIEGVRFDMSDDELAATDAYEVDAYSRSEVRLESGMSASVYVG